MTMYKIGTRGSLLAVTQSTLLKNQLEELSGDRFELVTIKTQGDQITDRPLWQLEGKDFFTKELDEALLSQQVDLVIHSYKDLGSERPAGIKLAAVTERRFSQDVLLISTDVRDRLKNWVGDFVVGTSSPRRIANLTHSLAPYLPGISAGKNPVRCETLRGNVNSRIRKLKDGHYHAIVLALAGIERLAHTEKSAAELAELTRGLDYFVLPQSVFPAAASQGALGVEINEKRSDDGKLAALLAMLVHEDTVEEVLRERKAFKDFGGGCHLAVGIHVKKLGDGIFFHNHRGEVDGKRIESQRLEGFAPLKKYRTGKLFAGLPPSALRPGIVGDLYLKKVPLPVKCDLRDRHVFVTSKYCFESLEQSRDGGVEGIWAAGAKTLRDLARAGFWVNGSADSLGTQDLEALRSSKALRMIHRNLSAPWVVLTHPEGTSELGEVVGCYERHLEPIDAQFEQALQAVKACYWTSIAQFEAYIKRFPYLKDADHYCGLGKTWSEFKRRSIAVTPVSNMEEFYDLKEDHQ